VEEHWRIILMGVIGEEGSGVVEWWARGRERKNQS